MKVLRMHDLETEEFIVGDRITIALKDPESREIHEFTATAQKITDDGTLFMFDECVARRAMNDKATNRGGFEFSDLQAWLDDCLLPCFPKGLRPRIRNLTVPTYGQIFGHDNWYEEVMEPDGDEQFPLMAKRENRVADFNDEWNGYWLKNAVQKTVSSANFAYVYYHGNASYGNASIPYIGVRPVFLLRSDEKKFKLGRVVVTAGIADLMNANSRFEFFVKNSLGRFIKGDLGDLCDEDKAASDKAVTSGEMIMGAYKHHGVEIWIITEWDRSATTILFPHER